MRFDLPESVEINGKEYAIRSDFRAILDILALLSDAELDDQERAEGMLEIFYPSFSDMPPEDYEEAVRQCTCFIDGGEGEMLRQEKPGPRLMDWQQDFPLIAAAVNRVLGYECRAAQHCHWWTFLAAFREIGDCTFAQVVSIRSKKAAGKRLDKSEQDFYRKHRRLVDLQRQYTVRDEAVVNQWI